MEIRKVQMTGGSSYVLTLPKDWVHSLNIKKNDPLGVITQGNGDLIITGNITESNIQRRKIFYIETREDPVSFFRNLVGSYIAGYNCIDIRSKDRITPLFRKTIRDFTDQVIGLELVEEESTSILLRDLFNPLEMPFENSLKRMYVITKGMYADSIGALCTRDKSLALDVVLRDREVDRLYWLIARQANIILHYPRYGERMNTSIIQVIHFFQTAKIVERIADHAVLIAQSIQELDLTVVKEETTTVVRAASEEVMKTFDKSITIFFSNDLHKANRIIESVYLHQDTYHLINDEILLLPTQIALFVRKISDSIRRVEEYSADIAELVINYEMSLNIQDQV
jgi:phosphate uptake regulator